MIIASISAILFIIVALANIAIFIKQIQVKEDNGPSFVMGIGPLSGAVFLFTNPWGISGGWWLILFLDIGFSVILIGIVIELLGKRKGESVGRGDS